MPDDPDPAALRNGEALEAAEEFEDACDEYEAMLETHPRSAMLHMRIAGIAAYEIPTGGRRAIKHYRGALEIGGLSEHDEWLAQVGIATLQIAQGLQRDFAGAIETLTAALGRWPTDREARYLLACARCATRDVDGAVRELARVFTGFDEPPRFLADDAHTAAEYIARAKEEILLVPARRDPRYAELLAR